ncbi:hypothetical protein DFH06DRAFT_1314161 [Mycena polygramma]|nr:hypothetical protein DFH06DRAFT_1314161 [Mycena polygramma]
MSLEDMGPPPFDIAVDLATLIAREEHTMQDQPHIPTSEPMDVDNSESEHPAEDRWDFDRDSDSDSDSDSEFDSEDLIVSKPDGGPDMTMEVDEYNDPEYDALVAAYHDPLDAPAQHTPSAI